MLSVTKISPEPPVFPYGQTTVLDLLLHLPYKLNKLL